MASSREDFNRISPSVDYISIILRLRGPTTLPQILNYIHISPFCTEVGSTTDQVELFLLKHPLHFNIKEDVRSIVGFGNTVPNKIVRVKTIFVGPSDKNKTTNHGATTTKSCVVDENPRHSLKTEDGRECANAQSSRPDIVLIQTVSVASQNRNNTSLCDLQTSGVSSEVQLNTSSPSAEVCLSRQIISASEVYDASRHRLDRSEGIKILKKALLDNGPLPVKRLVGYLSNVRKSILESVGKNEEELLRFLVADNNFRVEGVKHVVYVNQLKEICIPVQKICRTEAKDIKSSATVISISSKVKATQVPCKVLNSSQISKDIQNKMGVNFLISILSDGPLPLQNLVGYLGNATKSVRDTVGPSSLQLLTFLRRNHMFVVTGNNNIAAIKSKTSTVVEGMNSFVHVKSPDSCRPVPKECSNVAMVVRTAAISTSTNEKANILKSISGPIKVSSSSSISSHCSQLQYENEGLDFLFKTLSVNGPMPLMRLLGYLGSQATSIRETVGCYPRCNASNLFDFLNGNNIFVVTGKNDLVAIRCKTSNSTVKGANSCALVTTSSCALVTTGSCTLVTTGGCAPVTKISIVSNNITTPAISSSSLIKSTLSNYVKSAQHSRIVSTSSEISSVIKSKESVIKEKASTTIKPTVAVATIKSMVPVATIKPTVAVATIKPMIAVASIKPVVAVATITPMISVASIKTIAAVTSIKPLVTVPPSNSEKSTQIVARNLPLPSFSSRDSARKEVIKNFTKALKNNGPMPLSSLVGNLSQMTRAVRTASLGCHSSYLDFILNDNHFIVVGLGDKCVIHLNAKMVNHQVSHQIEQPIKNKNINSNLLKADCERRNLLSTNDEKQSKSTSISQQIDIHVNSLTVREANSLASSKTIETSKTIKSSIGKDATCASPNAVSVSSVRLKLAAPLCIKLSVQTAAETEGVQLLNKIISERGSLPAEWLFGSLASASKTVRTALGKNPEKFLQYLLKSKQYIVEKGTHIVHMNTKHNSNSREQNYNSKTSIIGDRVPDLSIATLAKSGQLPGAAELVPSLKSTQLSTSRIFADTPAPTLKLSTTGLCPEFILSKLSSDTPALNLKSTQLSTSKLASKIPAPSSQISMQLSTTSLSHDFSSHNLNSTQLITPPDAPDSKIIFANYSSIELLVLKRLTKMIFKYGPFSFEKLELVLLGDKYAEQLTLPEVLEMLSDDPDARLLNDCTLIKDFILLHNDRFATVDEFVYLVNSTEYTIAIQEYKLKLDEHKSRKTPFETFSQSSPLNEMDEGEKDCDNDIFQFKPSSDGEFICPSEIQSVSNMSAEYLLDISSSSKASETTSSGLYYIESMIMKRVINLITKFGPISIEKLELVLVGDIDSKQSTLPELLAVLRGLPDFCLESKHLVEDFIFLHSDVFYTVDDIVYLVNSKEYASELKESIVASLKLEAQKSIPHISRKSRKKSLRRLANPNDYLPCALLSSQVNSRLEGIRILTEAIRNKGPLPFNRLIGYLCTTTQAVRDAIGGYHPRYLLDFIRNDNHFMVVVGHENKCVIHLNPEMVNHEVCNRIEQMVETKNPNPSILNDECEKKNELDKSDVNQKKSRSISFKMDIDVDSSECAVINESKEVETTEVLDKIEGCLTQTGMVWRVRVEDSSMNGEELKKLDGNHLELESRCQIRGGILELDESRHTPEPKPSVENSALEFLVKLIGSHGPLSLLILHVYRHLVTPEVYQCFGITFELPFFQVGKLKEFCTKHSDVLCYRKENIYLVDSFSMFGSSINVESALNLSPVDQNCSHEKVTTEPKVILGDPISLHQEYSSKNIHVEVRAVECIISIIEKFGPIFFDSLKPLLLGQKWGQKASSLDVLIYLSGSREVELLTTAALKGFILKHSNELRKHDGKVYIVNSEQKASQLIQKQHHESILLELSSWKKQTSCCRPTSQSLQEACNKERRNYDFEAVPPLNFLQDDSESSSNVQLNACNEIDKDRYATVEASALEFLFEFITSYGPIEFQTLISYQHMASLEVQQSLGATAEKPFFVRSMLRQFCQRHCDVLTATNRLHISLVESNSCTLDTSIPSAEVYSSKLDASTVESESKECVLKNKPEEILATESLTTSAKESSTFPPFESEMSFASEISFSSEIKLHSVAESSRERCVTNECNRRKAKVDIWKDIYHASHYNLKVSSKTKRLGV